MNNLLIHRGPDDQGVWHDKDHGIYLGHRRLSILDLSAHGRQPMRSQSGNVIVFNGEIYNFKELKTKCPNDTFYSNSDTEVILKLYESKGLSALQDFNGMFAFALWDHQSEQLFLARDRIGIKPLYYCCINGIFAFSSEIKSLLTLPWVNAEVDEKALYDFLTFNKVPIPRTMFKDIRKFHPGHFMVVGNNGIERYNKFWEISYSHVIPRDEQEIAGTIAAHLAKSVQYRMVSDVPVGAFLSGGVDSSAVVALMSKFATGPVKTYSIGFKGAPNYDERYHAEKISKRFSTEHHEKIISREEIVDFLPQIVEHYDEPLADATSIPIFFISKLAKEHGSKVVLTGDGADELFCGYRNWLRYPKINPVFNAITKSPAVLKTLLGECIGLFGKETPIYEIITRARRNQTLFWGGAGAFKEAMKHRILSDEYRHRMAEYDSHQHIQVLQNLYDQLIPKSRERDYIDWMCFSGVKDIIPNYYLYRADRLGMAHSVELRVPFLDHQFVDTALSVPSRHKIKNGEPKYILKKALEPLLPHETLYRKKQGFCVPLGEWMKESIVRNIDASIDSFCSQTSYFNKDGIRTLIDQCNRGNTNVVFSLWNIYFLIAWFRKWLI